MDSISLDSIAVLELGIDSWNHWRASHPPDTCSLAGQDLSHGYFFEGRFDGVNLRGANLQRACLIGADLRGADLSGADLSGAYLGDANLSGANLSHANLSEANLDRADLRRANLLGTQIADADFRTAKLSDPSQDPYVDEVAYLLSQCVPAIAAAKSTAKGDINDPVHRQRLDQKAVRRSLLQQMAESLQSLTGESPQAAALRQQAIRQSAIALPAKPSNHLLQPVKPSATKKRSTTKKLSQSDSSLAIGLRQQRKNSTKNNWGRRSADRRWSSQLSRYFERRVVWMPTLAAGMLLAVGLPVGIASLGPQQVAAQSSETFALSKSLTGGSQMWAVATHAAQSGDRIPWVIGGGANGNIEIWNGKTGEPIRTLAGHTDGIRTLAMSASGDWLVSGSSDGLKVWRPETGVLEYSLPKAQASVWSVAIAPDGKTFVSSDNTGRMTAWDLAKGEELYRIETDAPVWSVAIAPDGQSFVGGSGDAAVRQWDLASGRLLKTFDGHDDAVRAVAISPDGRTLVSGSSDKTIKLWSLASGSLQTTFNTENGGHNGQIASLAISADGETLASGSNDSTVKLWDLPNRQISDTLNDHSNWITAVAFDPQTSTLVSGGKDQTIKVWQ